MNSETSKNLVTIFSRHNINYTFQISKDFRRPSWVLTDIGALETIYVEFEAALQKKIPKEMTTDTVLYRFSELAIYIHAIKMSKSYWQAKSNQEYTNMTEADVCIYAFYLEEKHKEFYQWAQEIDAEISAELDA